MDRLKKGYQFFSIFVGFCEVSQDVICTTIQVSYVQYGVVTDTVLSYLVIRIKSIYSIYRAEYP